MRTRLEKAHDISSIGTFVLTIVIVAFMVFPMLPGGSTDTAAPRNHPVIGWLMPSVLAVCLLVAGILNLLAARNRSIPGNSNRPTLSPIHVPISATLPVNQVEGRDFVGASITPEYLVGLFRDHTYIQSGKLVKPFIGKWIRVSGKLNEVMSSSPDLAQVTFSGRGIASELATIYMYFQNEDAIERLAILRREDDLTIIGKIKEVNGVRIDLWNCELEG